MIGGSNAGGGGGGGIKVLVDGEKMKAKELDLEFNLILKMQENFEGKTLPIKDRTYQNTCVVDNFMYYTGDDATSGNLYKINLDTLAKTEVAKIFDYNYSIRLKQYISLLHKDDYIYISTGNVYVKGTWAYNLKTNTVATISTNITAGEKRDENTYLPRCGDMCIFKNKLYLASLSDKELYIYRLDDEAFNQITRIKYGNYSQGYATFYEKNENRQDVIYLQWGTYLLEFDGNTVKKLNEDNYPSFCFFKYDHFLSLEQYGEYNDNLRIESYNVKKNSWYTMKEINIDSKNSAKRLWYADVPIISSAADGSTKDVFYELGLVVSKYIS